MKKTVIRLLGIIIAVLVMISGCGTATDPYGSAPPAEASGTDEAVSIIDRDGVYTSRDDVALYIYTYGRLPDNFITKKEARACGWPGGGLDGYADGKCIGGDRYNNFEGKLPDKPGREYRECDIDTLHAGKRGPKRLVYSNDRLIYYTGDHYETFELMYGEE